MPITGEIFQAFLNCETKSHLLSSGAVGTQREFVDWQDRQAETYKQDCLNRLRAKYQEDEKLICQGTPGDLKKAAFCLVVECSLQADGLQTQSHALEPLSPSEQKKHGAYLPIRFVPREKVTSQDKLLLAFDALVLGAVSARQPASGKIIHGVDQKVMKVNLSDLVGKAKTIVGKIAAQQANTSSPPLILNRHCAYCQYKQLCRTKAEQADNLSLLSGMTPKLIQRYEKKGVFTIKQLSYLFKPRRAGRKSSKPPTTHKPELQALAIRTGKIYVQKLPDLSAQEVELFLDIEGIPDQSAYYLIGLLLRENGVDTYQSFWADKLQDEAEIWQGFLERINQYPAAPIYHYGSYEPVAIDKLSKRQGADSTNLQKRLINVNASIYGKVYFPVCSNGLKDIGGFLGAKWTAPNASGLQSLVWRYYWDETKDSSYRETLVAYNREDCLALKFLKDKLTEISGSADILSEVDFTDQPKRLSTKPGEQVHSHFETILKFARSDYDKKKIHFRQEGDESQCVEKTKRKNSKKGYQGQRKKRPNAQKTIQVPPATMCPEHNRRLVRTDRTAKRLIIDLVPKKNGIRKTITEYVGFQGYCVKCYRYHSPPDIRKFGANQLYGHGFQAWVIYQRVALRMTYGAIAEAMAEQFNEKEPGETISPFIRNLSEYYAETEKIVIRNLLNSPFIHADETTINIRGITQYVWTFTNDKYVVFKLSKTREAQIAQDFLSSYRGILISDFYAGYDSIECKQQRCWVHLIRDLNDDLWEFPLDGEYEVFVSEVRSLIVLIMETVQKYGLKKYHLNKFTKQVDKFYERVITDKSYKSELALKYQKRFVRYRESLFTFLEHDGVPWHNNTAERALRHLAKQRSISGNFHETVTPDYLRLLGIRQTCRFQGKSFLKFLFSKERDIDQFKPGRNKKT